MNTLYVCHGDTKGGSLHPCSKVQKALDAKGIAYEKKIGGRGNPIPFLRKDDRQEVQAATGGTNLPSMKLEDGTVLKDSKAILAWVGRQPG